MDQLMEYGKQGQPQYVRYVGNVQLPVLAAKSRIRAREQKRKGLNAAATDEPF